MFTRSQTGENTRRTHPEAPPCSGGDPTHVVRLCVLVPRYYEVAVKTARVEDACAHALRTVRTCTIQGRDAPEQAGAPYVHSVSRYSSRDRFVPVPAQYGPAVLRTVVERFLHAAKWLG